MMLYPWKVADPSVPELPPPPPTPVPPGLPPPAVMVTFAMVKSLVDADPLDPA
jgi:hypothetical protein